MILNDILSLTKEAGEIAMKYYTQGVQVTYKNNDAYDPLTQADLEIDAFLRSGVKNLLDVSILSEEHESKDLDYKEDVWMIDPIDGTKDFVGGSGKFSIMVGLCRGSSPYLGVVYLPFFDVFYYAQAGMGSYKKVGGEAPVRLSVSSISSLDQVQCVGKSQFSESRVIESKIKLALGIKNLMVGGTVGGILGELAEGSADIYFFTNPRGGKWDICAPQIILEEAGGKVTDTIGKSIQYDSPGYKIEQGFIASNGLLHQQALEAYKNI